MVIAVGFTLALAGIAFSKSEAENARLSKQVTVVCQEHKLLASIAHETLADQIQQSKTLLPKLNFPGLSHQQLIELTERKQLQESVNLGKLELVAKETC